MTNEQKIDQMASDIKEIKDAMLGNEYNNEGLCKIVDRHDNDIAELKLSEQKRKWARATWATIGAAILAVFELFREMVSDII